MNKRERQQQQQMFDALRACGFTHDECEALRRISMTLHRWYELECGDSNTYGSWAIERDETTEVAYMVRHHYRHGAGKDTVTRERIADRETGAKKRLARIIDACNKARRTHMTDDKMTPQEPLSYYIQTDPRGSALFILRPGDIPEGSKPDECYSRGICVY